MRTTLGPLARQLARSTQLASRPHAQASQPSWRALRACGPARRTLHASAPAWRKIPSSGQISYEQLKPLTEQPSDDVLLIDVREPDEVMYGSIPSSVNLPLSQLEKAMKLEDGRFQKQFAFAKPSKSQDIIVYCKAGVRAGSAIKYLQEKGYKNVANYTGSYDDWQKREQQA